MFLLASSAFQDVNVFTKGEGGYFCIKIPSLVVTTSGTIIAFGGIYFSSRIPIIRN